MRCFVGRPALSGSLEVTLCALTLRAGCCVGTAAEVVVRHPLTVCTEVREPEETRASWRSPALGCGGSRCRLGVTVRGLKQRDAGLHGAVALGQPGTRDPRCCFE